MSTEAKTDLTHEIASYAALRARRYRLGLAGRDIAEETSHLEQDLGDAEADLSGRLRDHGPQVVGGVEYSHAERDGCDVVKVRPVGGRR
jgi:hypothetical protein